MGRGANRRNTDRRARFAMEDVVVRPPVDGDRLLEASLTAL